MADTSNKTTAELVSRPPYCSFDTFDRFLAMLKSDGLPSQIDTSLMTNLSGGVQSQVLIGLRFLGLIDEKSNVLPRLRILTESHGTNTWTKELAGLVTSAYRKIVSSLDMMTATPKQLSEAFNTEGEVTGSTRDKSVRFYLRARDVAGMKHSSHFAKTRGPGQGRKKRRTGGAPSGEPPPGIVAPLPNGMMRHTIYIPGKPEGHIEIPESIDEDDIPLIENVVNLIGLYAKRAAGGESNGEPE